ncbi:Arabinose import ATP-binding protein AraG [Serratia fonticola]|uniref:Arabinose import ATP-binding protein AraG n=1 Tax=Serratia fonticola TaxID=47917 RepID=A0A4U9TE82_SERFO|nr:Arabinose import ATP-binding protein AraG [Serratia fonticola]
MFKGEILGFAGLVGSGRTETVSALIGASACYRKQVSLSGQQPPCGTPALALKQGIGLLPESRKTEGFGAAFFRSTKHHPQPPRAVRQDIR